MCETILQRMEALRLHLQTVYPEWRVVPAVRPGAAGHAGDLLRPPSIRIRPPEMRADGMIRWTLEFWPVVASTADGKLSGEEGVLRAAAALRESLLSGEGAVAYMPLGGGPAGSRPGTLYWTEMLGEPCRPANFRPAAFLTDIREVAFLGPETHPGGATSLGEVSYAEDTPDAGSTFCARDGGGLVYLGTAEETAPELLLTAPLPRALGPGTILSVAGLVRSAPGPVHQTVRHNRLTGERLHTTLAGGRLRRRVAPTLGRLRVVLPPLRRGEASSWELFLAEHQIRPSLLWGGEDGRLYDATPVFWESDLPAGATAAVFSCEMDVLPAETLTPHMEEAP